MSLSVRGGGQLQFFENFTTLGHLLELPVYAAKFFYFHAFLCIFDIFGEHFHSSYHFIMTPPFYGFLKNFDRGLSFLSIKILPKIKEIPQIGKFLTLAESFF